MHACCLSCLACMRACARACMRAGMCACMLPSSHACCVSSGGVACVRARTHGRSWLGGLSGICLHGQIWSKYSAALFPSHLPARAVFAFHWAPPLARNILSNFSWLSRKWRIDRQGMDQEHRFDQSSKNAELILDDYSNFLESFLFISFHSLGMSSVVS